jgi:general secretion pathway protein G
MGSLRHRRNRRGFTLMEMLIVLGIVVMLLAMVGPRLIGAGKKADISGTQIQLKSLRESLKQYWNDMREYPTTEQGLNALVEKPSDLSDEKASRWDGPYVEGEKLPKDAWGHEFQYEYPPKNGAGKDPDIWSFGPDGEDGTDDDIVSWTKDSSDEKGSGDSKTGSTDRSE